jgi:hypothetical protein
MPASTPTYSISGTISGLTSTGLVLAIGGQNVVVPPGKTGSFTQLLAASLPSGTQYSVAVKAQPSGQTCAVAGGTGKIGSANVANVVVTCADQAFVLGGTLSGLNVPGLVLANGSDTLTVMSGATSFTMPTNVPYTSSYAVTVLTQPAGVTCTVNGGAGVMPPNAVMSVSITCTDQPFRLGGTISGLGARSGLVLANGSDTLTVAANATSFVMPTQVSFGSAYSVTVQSSPSELTCTLSNGSGTMPASNVTQIERTAAGPDLFVEQRQRHRGRGPGDGYSNHVLAGDVHLGRIDQWLGERRGPGARQRYRHSNRAGQCNQLHDAHRPRGRHIV